MRIWGKCWKFKEKRWRCSKPSLSKVNMINAGSLRRLSDFTDLSLCLSRVHCFDRPKTLWLTFLRHTEKNLRTLGKQSWDEAMAYLFFRVRFSAVPRTAWITVLISQWVLSNSTSRPWHYLHANDHDSTSRRNIGRKKKITAAGEQGSMHTHTHTTMISVFGPGPTCSRNLMTMTNVLRHWPNIPVPHLPTSCPALVVVVKR